MQESDRTEFNRMFFRLAEVFQRAVASDLADTYFGAMKQYPVEAVARACKSAAEDCEWFPKPVELRSYASVPDRLNYEEIDGERVFACLECRDTEIILKERFSIRGYSLGMFGSPCRCFMGQRLRAAWEKPDSRGQTFADSSKDNTVKVRTA
jgi:hypothetical protein